MKKLAKSLSDKNPYYLLRTMMHDLSSKSPDKWKHEELVAFHEEIERLGLGPKKNADCDCAGECKRGVE